MTIALAFATILATCVAGILNVSWWAAVACACVLALISMTSQPMSYRGGGGAIAAPEYLMASRLLNASVTGAAAMAAGRLIGWLWGV